MNVRLIFSIFNSKPTYLITSNIIFLLLFMVFVFLNLKEDRILK
jgi:hypothetical protein